MKKREYLMLKLRLTICALLAGFISAVNAGSPVAIAIHGGAGTILRSELNPEKEQRIRATLEQAVVAGHTVLANGGSSLDAVTAALTLLEDSPLFNAGKGAVFNALGNNELDASIMDGATLNAGAVASVRRIKNPILLAQKVMTDSPHVLLVGEGAEAFARTVGIEIVEPEYFHTDFRWQQLQKIKAREELRSTYRDSWYSTVGAVALDQQGNLAAGTSTGGTSNKRWGRIGDSPVIGAGTYANNKSCAVSATGHGEFFIRSVVAYDICARVQYNNQSLAESARQVVQEELVKIGGDGGIISIDQQGELVFEFNTPGMYRAAIDKHGQRTIAIYKNGD